jgi:hypothetical protein
MTTEISSTTLDVATPPASHRRRRTVLSRRGALVIDGVLLAVLAALVFVVHDVAYMFTHPFWVDESWVAVSTRGSLSQLPWLTSSTPLGWSFLLRFVPAGGTEALRVVPLVFTVLTVVAAGLLGRQLGLFRHLGMLVLGGAALLSPAMLVRADLKQYTAEACASIVVLLLVARIEDGWTRRRLAGLTVFVIVGFLFANTVVFVGVAAMGGLLLAATVRRQWRRVIEVVLASIAMMAGTVIVYELVIKSHRLRSLTNSKNWDGYYVPHSPGAALSFVRLRIHQLAPYIGFNHAWIDLVLAVAGVATLVVLGRYALAFVVPATGFVLLVASAARAYPFGDIRTSTFLSAMVTVLMAIGLLGALRILASWHRAVMVVTLMAVAIGWVVTVHPDIRSQTIPNEDVRSQVQYVDAHRRPGDVVILSYSASYGFAYYDRSLTPSFIHVPYASVGFLPVFPRVPWLVQMKNLNPADVSTALARAIAKVHHEDTGNGVAPATGRIWIIRSHMHPPEILAWQHDLAGKNVRTIDVGPEPLLLYRPS